MSTQARSQQQPPPPRTANDGDGGAGTTTLSSVDIRGAGEANAVFGGDTSVMVARPGEFSRGA